QSATEKLSRSGSFTFNFRTGEVYWSDGLFELADRTHGEGPASDDELHKLMSEKEFKKLNNLLQKARISKHPIRGEFKVVLKKRPTMFIDIETYRDPFFSENEPKIIGIVRDKTDLQRIQISLSSSEEKFRNIFKTVPDGLVVSSFDKGLIIDFNSAFLDLTRYSDEDVRNHTSVELKLFVDSGTRKNFFSELHDGLSIVNKEHGLRTKFGEIIDVLVSSTIISIDGENFMLSVIRDVSEIKRVERELKKSNTRLLASEEKFTTFLKHSPDGIMMTDEQGNVQEWNNSMESLTGIGQTDAKGSGLITLWSQILSLSRGQVRDIEQLKNQLKTFFATGNKDMIPLKESREINIPGIGRRHVENYTFPIKSDKGYRIGQISRDITEQKEFENNVLLYRDIFMNNEDGIAVLDLNGKYTEFNPAHQALLGYKDDELLGRSPAVFLGEKRFNEIFKVYDYQKAFEGELVARKKNGRDVYLDFILFPVLSGDSPVCIVSVIRDISERKQTEKKLIEARREAEEADALKTAFLSNMSHEIRTPMNSIIGFSGLLNKPGLTDEKRHKYVGYINRNGANLLNLIDDIIDISKIESNQLKIQKSAVNIHEVTEDLFVSMTRVLKQEGKTSLRLVKNYPDQEFWIHTDGFRLRQVMVNLVHNAIKFTDKGSVEIGYNAGPGQHILFHVKDTGIGIPTELKDTIFERFRKLENVKKKIYGGAGLGLAISRQLIHLLGGKIWVESYVGKGTAFYFTIPMIRSERADERHESIPGMKEHNQWQGKHILIVEDDLYSFELISEFLEGTGAEFHHVADGRDAVNFMTARKDIDLVIMDIQVPGMNGYKATRLIKTITPEVPVIAQTAFAMDEDRKLASSAGCSDFLTKPVDRKTFLGILEKYLGQPETS
ncbi:MAG TPA: PAS domain S-box protein, partial [Bacteroidales bacterium]|nr:PAS domain S-box protein [Bacteroidales bacterium]